MHLVRGMNFGAITILFHRERNRLGKNRNSIPLFGWFKEQKWNKHTKDRITYTLNITPYIFKYINKYMHTHMQAQTEAKTDIHKYIYVCVHTCIYTLGLENS